MKYPNMIGISWVPGWICTTRESHTTKLDCWEGLELSRHKSEGVFDREMLQIFESCELWACRAYDFT